MEMESLKGLEFYRVIEEIAGYCHSQATKALISNIFPFGDLNLIVERFGQIREITRLRDEGFSLCLHDFPDISGILEKVRPEGAVLDPGEILSLLPVLSLIEEVSAVLNRKDIVYLKPFLEGFTGFPSIRLRIEKSIDNDGNIIDLASPTLAELRNRKRSIEKRIKKRLEDLIMDRRISTFLQDSFISMRSGRWVIPVRMDSKGEVKGIVHDVSRSGDTAFIEPAEIMELSNEFENIIAEERVEELRILRDISGLIRIESEEIKRQFSILITIDLLNSIVLFSERIKARIPDINESGHLSLCDARHPILLISREDKEVVPLNIKINASERVVVITGPNAGGKTVAVKTIGLLTAMALSGIPIPANQSSSIPLVRNIYVDIGDEQSILDNLSTFSAHISHISDFLSRTGAEDMVIIDELGTGTDPSQGAALGCAILEELRDRGAIVFATTHLVDIVGFVYSSKGMINASMEFDCRTLSPLYRLKIGEPGESHAFDIAIRYGLPESVIEKARLRLGNGANLCRLINELNNRRNNYEGLIREEQERMKELRDQERRIRIMFDNVERERKEILKKAYEEAKEIVFDVRKRLNQLMQEMRVKDPRLLTKEIENINNEVEGRIRDLSDEPRLDINNIREGDTVFVKSIGENLKVIRVFKERRAVKVRLRNMEVEIALEDLCPPRGLMKKDQKGIFVDVEETVEGKLNIMGLKVDEGMRKLESFLNHAFLAGLKEVRIIHGIGKGILLKAVKEYLKGHELVEDFYHAEGGHGGKGVTIIRLASKV